MNENVKRINSDDVGASLYHQANKRQSHQINIYNQNQQAMIQHQIQNTNQMSGFEQQIQN